MTIQYIKKNGRKLFAVLDYADYIRMQRKLKAYANFLSADKASTKPPTTRHRSFLKTS